MKVAFSDEGEIARSIAKYVEGEVVVTPTPARVSEESPDVLIHTMESDADRRSMWNTNVWYALSLARVANKLGAVNVYLSTYMVFDGTRGMYSETSVPSPLNYYGMTKLMGEVAIMSLGNYLVLRLGQVITRGFFKGIIRSLISRGIAKCNEDFYLSPLNFRELGYAVWSLIKKGARGVVNVGGKRVSQVRVCEALAEAFGGEVISVKGGYRDFSLDDWLLRSYGITVRGLEV